jgi:release factor glutamine methyltransferase
MQFPPPGLRILAILPGGIMFQSGETTNFRRPRMALTMSPRSTVARLAEAGFLAPAEEADALRRASVEGAGTLDHLLERRLRGEPLPWIVGSIEFCGLRIHVDPGVFVPRPHTEALARRAAALLPDDGRAVDLCTGSGAVAAVMLGVHPDAEVLATDIDPVAVACAQRNGVRALEGDLDAPLPRDRHGTVDVMTAVVPYVPSEELHLLPRDVLANEPRRALDGGKRGMATLTRAAESAARWLRPGGIALLELGGDQAVALATMLEEAGLAEVRVHRDEDGRDRSIEARRVLGRKT